MWEIVGVTGTYRAGKGEIVKYFVEQRGFEHYSVSGFIIEEIVRRGWPVDRAAMIEVGNELRHAHGATYIIDALFERVRTARVSGVVESLRAVAEVRRVQKLGGLVVGVDANPRIRHRRALAAATEKDLVRSGKYSRLITFKEFLAQERSEMNPGDPTKQDLAGAMAAADVIVMNDGTVEELYAKLDVAVGARH